MIYALIYLLKSKNRDRSQEVMIRSKLHLFRNLPRHIHRCISMSKAAGSPPLVLTERLDQVFIITINRPEKRNCVNNDTATALEKAVQQLEADDSLLVGILQGQGGNFCAGYDLLELSGLPQEPATPLPSAEALERGRGPMGPSRRFIKKPLIAALEGYAVAGGLELALMCDMRVVSDTAVLGVFCRRFGVPLLDGGTVRLPQLIGLSRAMDLILTGRAVKGPEALSLGLANRLVATGTTLGEAVKIAQTLCNFPQQCMRRDRLSAYNSCYDAESYDKAFQFEYDNAIHVIQEESIKGASTFVKGFGRKGSFNLHKSNL